MILFDLRHEINEATIAKWCSYNIYDCQVSNVGRVLHLTARQCPGARGAWGNQLSCQLWQMLTDF